ncbi:DnaD domain protein [Streptococcus sp. DD12]|uniref:DnaD domain protein n=1 Tax=Streptococcus sp. DD12 TaxID=1777880 RepID=UPI0007993533|nr:DnaD domain protein [Streptococcus sp. DD12]KXT75219.1 Helicase loader DnaB [Streptococcus sp. DD12]
MKASDHFHYLAANKIAQAQPSLLSCYLPIVGNEAVLLYQYFLAFYDAGAVAHRFSEILNHMQFGMAPLQKNLAILEGIGLIKHYQQGDDHWFLLRPALATQTFLKQAVLESLLTQKIGEPAVAHLKQQVPSAEDVTRSFAQVFGDQGQVLTPEAETAVETFAFDYFKEQMAKDGLRFEDEQADTITLYRLAEQEKLTWHQLYVIAKETASRKVIRPQRILATLKKPQTTGQLSLTAKEAVVVQEAQRDSAATFLAKIKKTRHAQVTKQERDVLEDLAQQGFLDEVINVMVLYTLNKTRSANLNKRYITKLANDFAYQKVTTAADAILKMRDFKEAKRSNQKKSQAPAQTNVPEWSNPSYENQTTQADLAELEALRKRSRERLEKLGKDTK